MIPSDPPPTSGFPPTEERLVREYRADCKRCDFKGEWRMFIKKARDDCREHYKEKHPA